MKAKKPYGVVFFSLRTSDFDKNTLRTVSTHPRSSPRLRFNTYYTFQKLTQKEIHQAAIQLSRNFQDGVVLPVA